MSKYYENPYISLIVPVRNEERYIHGCMESILNQNYDKEKFEVIVVDGMSTDRTQQIVRQFKKKHSNIKLLKNPVKSTPSALNLSLRSAKGEIIVRVDGHAEIEYDYLTQCINFLHLTGADCVCGVIKSVQTNIIGKAIALGMSSVFGVGNARFRTSGREGFVDTGAFLAYRREVFERNGVFSESCIGCEDDEFHHRLRSKGGRIFFTPKIQSKYFTRSNYRDLFKQYFRYGYGKVTVFKLHPPMMQWRQAIPPLFVLGFVLSLLLYPLAGIAVLFLPIIYFMLSLATTTVICRRDGWRHFLFLPPVFLCLHFGYGSGFILGVLGFCFREILVVLKA